MELEKDGLYKTSDLYYAAYLKVARVPFKGTEKEGTRVIFIFEAIPGLRDLKAAFFNRSGMVPALSYSEEVKVMKTLTFM